MMDRARHGVGQAQNGGLMRNHQTEIHVAGMSLVLSCLLLGAIGPGCGGSGAPIPDDEKFNAIQLGMSEAEVIEILGPPTRAVTHPQVSSLRLLEYGEKSRVVLDGGKVDTVVLREEPLVEAERADDAE